MLELLILGLILNYIYYNPSNVNVTIISRTIPKNQLIDFIIITSIYIAQHEMSTRSNRRLIIMFCMTRHVKQNSLALLTFVWSFPLFYRLPTFPMYMCQAMNKCEPACGEDFRKKIVCVLFDDLLQFGP